MVRDLGVRGAVVVPLRRTNWVLTDRVSLGTPLDGVVVNAVFGSAARRPARRVQWVQQVVHHRRLAHDVQDDGVSTLIACEGAAGKVETKYLASCWRGSVRADLRLDLTLSTVPGAACSASAPRSAPRRSPCVGRHRLYTGVRSITDRRQHADTEVRGEHGVGRLRLQHLQRAGEGDRLRSDRPRAVPATLRACADPAIGTQEQQYLAALELAKTYQVTGNQLTLFRDGGTIAVTAQRTSN